MGLYPHPLLEDQIMDKPDYELTAKQKKFVAKAKKEGFTVDYGYSGRFMYGRKCPSVVCHPGEFGFKGCSVDNMAFDMVYYMP